MSPLKILFLVSRRTQQNQTEASWPQLNRQTNQFGTILTNVAEQKQLLIIFTLKSSWKRLNWDLFGRAN